METINMETCNFELREDTLQLQESMIYIKLLQDYSEGAVISGQQSYLLPSADIDGGEFNREQLLPSVGVETACGPRSSRCWLTACTVHWDCLLSPAAAASAQGFIHYILELTEDAQSFFSKAAEAFCHMKKAAIHEGPWLMVNFRSQAWLHHHLGQEAYSPAYLIKGGRPYPSQSQEELHPKIYAEKAWTLMKFSRDKKALVV
ncbi:hypothetical protein EXN66_Car008238 [Channa argus]|uniref:Uncharacterized protein n=1 Tax=Channa argus TaxID=215402 RepID=A0A6G1PQL9_CHAAH|nr:hypothetical protein EXN66_Car008238 [Channa argus]